VIGLVSLYAVAAYRMMPSLDSLLKQLTSLRFSAAVIDNLEEHLRDIIHDQMVDDGHRQTLPFDQTIHLQSITFRYPNSSTLVLDNLSVKIPKNRSIAFVGPSGVGKSTLVDIVLGLLTPDAGKLIVDGVPVTSENLRSWQNGIGYVPQDIYLCDDTLVRNIAFGLDESDIDLDAVIAAAKLAHLHDFIEAELPDGYDTVVGERGTRLSGGQRQRVGIARALYHKPKVLVLDEATSSLDGITERIVTEAIQGLSGERTIVVIAHRLSTIRYCNAIHLMQSGKIVATGTYDELMTNNTMFQSMARNGE
jgi:ABC-type multidrug transport system fused ATPase/permease subunit